MCATIQKLRMWETFTWAAIPGGGWRSEERYQDNPVETAAEGGFNPSRNWVSVAEVASRLLRWPGRSVNVPEAPDGRTMIRRTVLVTDVSTDAARTVQRRTISAVGASPEEAARIEKRTPRGDCPASP